jgi:hypothetical protein
MKPAEDRTVVKESYPDFGGDSDSNDGGESELEEEKKEESE